MPQGGYRRPSEPAAVSGPGALSQRTDGRMPVMPGDGSYGDTTDMETIQGSAPMQGAPPQFSGPGLDDPSADPDQPVTAGAEMGDGPGPEMLGLDGEKDADITRLAAYLPVLELMVNQPNAHPSTRAWVRAIKAAL